MSDAERVTDLAAAIGLFRVDLRQPRIAVSKDRSVGTAPNRLLAATEQWLTDQQAVTVVADPADRIDLYA